MWAHDPRRPVPLLRTAEHLHVLHRVPARCAWATAPRSPSSSSCWPSASSSPTSSAPSGRPTDDRHPAPDRQGRRGPVPCRRPPVAARRPAQRPRLRTAGSTSSWRLFRCSGCCRSSSSWSPLRTFDDIAAHGVGSRPHSLHLRQASGRRGSTAASSGALINSMHRHHPHRAALAVPRLAGGLRAQPLPPAVPACGAADSCSAGNLLPPQILLIPVSSSASRSASTTSCSPLIVVQVGFGVGFYAFVLHGFMRAIPGEIQQAAASTARARADLLPDHPAAVPPGAGRADRPVVHLDLQRPDLGDHRAAHRHPRCPSPPPCSACRATSCPCGT